MILNRCCDILRDGCVKSQSKEDYDGIKMKSSFILIDVQSYIISVALLENGVLKEYYVEYANSTDIAGNIYKGKVVNILSGLQSAFVDFGDYTFEFSDAELEADALTARVKFVRKQS